ncbi:hypothetical protein [Celeribacter sp.]|uniref:hypothetical protein n=1 Tax=Celeribacter sp. TaxID=1890673 RepID=UPI003A923D47
MARKQRAFSLSSDNFRKILKNENGATEKPFGIVNACEVSATVPITPLWLAVCACSTL